MKILRRSDIVVVDSNLLEETPLWSESATYKKDDKVSDEKNLYKALKDNTNIPLSDISTWELLGANNKYALFDYFINTQSKAENEINITFSCFGAKGIYLSNLYGKNLDIEVLDTRSAKIIESISFKLYGDDVKSWSDYFFGFWLDKNKKAIFYERSTLTKNISFRIRLSGSSVVKIGHIVTGELKELGISLYKNSISALDFSKIITNENGNTQLNKGNYKKTNALTCVIKNIELDFVVESLIELRSEPIVFILSEHYNSLINFGVLKSWEMLLEKQDVSLYDIEIEGLI